MAPELPPWERFPHADTSSDTSSDLPHFSHLAVDDDPAAAVDDRRTEKKPRVASDDGPWKLFQPQPEKGDGFIEGLTDPQQYKEFAKGPPKGGAGFVLGTVPKGLAAADPVEAIAQNTQRYVEDLKRVPQMTAEELSAFRRRVEKDPAQATRISVQSAISDLLDGSKRVESWRSSRRPHRLPSALGEKGSDFAKTLLPAAPGYEQSVGRQLGEGLGTMLAGLPLPDLPASTVIGCRTSDSCEWRAFY
jgi:hypothetical protein